MKTPPDISRRERIPFISYMNVIAIILMVLEDSLHVYQGNDGGSSLPVNHILAYFVMPTFFFVSGFLMIYTCFLAGTRTPTVSEFLKSKVRRLLVPYFALTAITYFPRAAMSGFADDAIPLTINGFLRSFVMLDELPIPFFWYLQVLIMLMFIGYVCLSFGRKTKISPPLALTLLIILFLGVFLFVPTDGLKFFSLNYLGFYAPIFLCGGLYAWYRKKVDRVIPWSSPWFLLTVLILWLMLYLTCAFNQGLIAYEMTGVMVIISLAKILESKKIRVFDHLMGAGYVIFLLSWYMNVLSQQVLAHFVSLPWWVHTILSLVSGIYIPLLAYRYMHRHSESRWVKVSAFILGEKL